MLQYVTHSYCWALEQKRHYNNDKKFAYFVKKTHQFIWVLWSLLQIAVSCHIYCQKFLTQFTTK